MKRAIKNHRSDFAAIIGLLIISLIVASYIVVHERLRVPFFSSPQYTLNADFTEAKSVTPGQGQTVQISGVKVGEISGVKVQDGMAVVQMNIDSKYRHLVHTDATALLRPRTGLEDMLVELDPGTSGPIAQSGYTLPLENTTPTIESDEVLSSLDSDTREYLDLLVNGAGTGLKNNGGNELAQVLKRFEPTHRDLARLEKALGTRGRDLQQLIHALRVLNTALAQKRVQIKSLITASATVMHAFAVEGGNVSQAVKELPGALAQTTTTLLKVQQFSTALGPAAVNLLPAAQAIPAANQAVINLAIPSTPIIRDQIRPFTIDAQPVVRSLVPPATNLANATPNLARSFVVLNHLFNMLGYYPGGKQHGYLWWLAWLDHNARTLFSQQDANGVFRPLFLEFSCQQLGMIANTPSGPLSKLKKYVSVPMNLGPAQSACQASGNGFSAGNGGLPGLPLSSKLLTPNVPAAAAKASGTAGKASGTAAKTASAAAKSAATTNKATAPTATTTTTATTAATALASGTGGS